ncbi:MAG: hypothetical protein LBE49_04475 [Deltaproteobacteria bacterium]|jgi:hypothetical protein|nr:hypothetical protein [Deltaproteobacteria bacterium]
MALRLSAAAKEALRLSLRLSITLILTLAISLAVFPDAASAQKPRQDRAGNLYGPGLDKMRALTTKKRVKSSDCPGKTLALNVSTPYGIGIKKLDEAMARKHKRDVENIQKMAFKAIGEYCQPDFSQSESTYDRTFEAYDPGGGSLSVIYNVLILYYMAAHHSHGYEAFNYNLQTGEELTIGDLFLSPPGAAEGLEGLWAMIASAWCRYNDNKTIPNFYDMPDDTDWCANPARIALPKRLEGQPAMKDLGNAFLTPDGLELRLQPYDGWSYADGDAILVLDKPSLIRIGFNPALWGR